MTTRKAVEAEANGESVSLTFRGVRLVIPTGADADIRTMKYWEDGKVVNFVMSAVGDTQWTKLERAGVAKIRDLTELSEQMFKAMGASKGESQG